MDAKYIIDAIVALERASNMVVSPTPPSQEERGELSAKCWIAANALRIYSGIDRMQVEVDCVDANLNRMLK